jgi:hypothetical protein
LRDTHLQKQGGTTGIYPPEEVTRDIPIPKLQVPFHSLGTICKSLQCGTYEQLHELHRVLQCEEHPVGGIVHLLTIGVESTALPDGVPMPDVLTATPPG